MASGYHRFCVKVKVDGLSKFHQIPENDFLITKKPTFLDECCLLNFFSYGEVAYLATAWIMVLITGRREDASCQELHLT